MANRNASLIRSLEEQNETLTTAVEQHKKQRGNVWDVNGSIARDSRAKSERIAMLEHQLAEATRDVGKQTEQSGEEGGDGEDTDSALVMLVGVTFAALVFCFLLL